MASTSVAIAKVREMVQSGEAREIRLRCGLSCREISTDLGVHDSTVAKWENGAAVPRGRRALAYARLLRELEKTLR